MNPTGSHGMGSLFLALFLSEIGHEGDFDLNTARLAIEYYIGPVKYENKTGGRIDLYLWDKNNNSISLENKIYAGDQKQQIERYVNHNSVKNCVYYLTLHGKKADKSSAGNFQDGQDYHCLSYATTVIKWLESCQKEAVSQPIVRESIRQYIILIKKLTNQLSDNQMNDKILKLISENYEAALSVSDNIERAEISFAKVLFEGIYHGLKKHLKETQDDNWSVKIDHDLTERWSGVRMFRKDLDDFYLRIQGEPYVHKSSVIHGFVWKDLENHNEQLSVALEQEAEVYTNFKSSKHWARYQEVFQFHSPEERIRLFNTESREEMVAIAIQKMLDLKNFIDFNFS